MNTSTADRLQVILVVEAPPPGVSFAVQSGRDQLLPPFASTGDSLSFAFSLDLGAALADGAFNFRGPLAQGTPAERFVYLNSGTYAGQRQTPWERRAKIKLGDIPRDLVARAAGRPDLAIEGRLRGTARDGGPVCATVKPPDISWHLASRPAP
ncbi:MAG: hypothetical protein GTN84_19545 [Hydrogenophaga sp.]|uniref:DUF5990 family protein n=1 Tax=Hydrogenophaga sp. TaxID=1904254 RepID=UPI00169D0BC8|nr:DUF5990 family protein [Hydrogenophaga sp.]NIM43437.1 hypothetical protein [Hydrogenophaga sp.]NIN28506.1 hypothetical protein [Hydrogenophaga sp.]NIN32965.1 hypothetical protein [Hydrogenophaga sp.]NIN57640.1 hypothetical protein [Hydrogenophaga sp.]NIO53935.1 hypothetical protein [Hydrogenophaga sp.]